MQLILDAIWCFDIFIVCFLITYNLSNFLFLVVSFIDVRTWVSRPLWEKRANYIDSPFMPGITLLVPAYNEEVTIVDSIRSLLRLEYPKYEIVIVNDGSSDETVSVLQKAFGFRRSQIDYNNVLPTKRLRGLYVADVPENSMALRLLLLDKDNGGKSDALNAAINAAKGDYVMSMDADSVLVPDALIQLAIPILEQGNITMSVGGQVVPSNGCEVRDGKLIRVRLPTSWIAKFQIAEYIRSFTQGRTALSRLNSVLILSGVCAVFQREMALRIGGFLTKDMTNKIGIEYCGEHKHTVCEDMEIVVRLHRYLLDTGMKGRVVYFPMPLAWTEAPEEYVSLGKQRGRWYRGLWECLFLHKEAMFNPKYRQIGLFSLPYQLFFEALGPLLEFTGYLIVPFTWCMGILNVTVFYLFLVAVVGFSIMISSLSVCLGVWSEGRLSRGVYGLSILPYTPLEVGKMIVYGILGNIGYRQYIVWYQVKGFRDFLKGKQGWDKFARKGFSSLATTNEEEEE